MALVDRVQNVCVSLTTSMILLRMCHMCYSLQRIRKLLLLFGEKIWIRQQSYPFIYQQCITRMKPALYMGLCLFSMALAYLFIPIGFFISTGQTLESPDKRFAYLVSLPYDAQKPLNYILTSIGIFVFALMAATQSYARDAMLSFFVSFLCGQYEVLHGRIDRLIPECHAKWLRERVDRNATIGRNLKQLQDLYEERLQQLIIHHNHLIRFGEELNSFFSFPLFVNLSTATLQIGFGVFQFLISGKDSYGDFARFLLYVLAVTGQLFVICNLGNTLIFRSQETAEHLFNCNWEGGRISRYAMIFKQSDNEEFNALNEAFPMWPYIRYNPSGKRFQQKLNFMIMRCQRPVRLSAMNYATLSLETFGRILSSSLSYFALLKSFLDK
ncbi:odorant receptor 13a-like [Stomoxys calcitrans]|uniref:odorant receptor 13a-like n=1 Tax=Stomoxys calcitrans TaxID=35570 RepID=UPI0027E2ABCF|nr:odorant receptor 13a-like [Stomoxys calcitrans]